MKLNSARRGLKENARRHASTRLALFLFIFWNAHTRNTSAREANSFESRECVVLIHGLGRTAWSMKGLERHLKRHGYDVVNETYRSTRVTIEEAAEGWLADILVSPTVK